MELILIDDVFHLGRRGEVVRVAKGYGRNYLIPKGLAVLVTPGNLKMIEQQRLSQVKKEAKNREEAGILAEELSQLHLILSRKVGDSGALFGSVTTKDLSDLMHANGVEFDRRKILLQQPIKSIGNFQIELRPHVEVEAQFLVSVVPEEAGPIERLKKKDEESDQIVADLDARLAEIQASQEESEADKQPMSPPAEGSAEESEETPEPSPGS